MLQRTLFFGTTWTFTLTFDANKSQVILMPSQFDAKSWHLQNIKQTNIKTSSKNGIIKRMSFFLKKNWMLPGTYLKHLLLVDFFSRSHKGLLLLDWNVFSFWYFWEAPLLIAMDDICKTVDHQLNPKVAKSMQLYFMAIFFGFVMLCNCLSIFSYLIWGTCFFCNYVHIYKYFNWPLVNLMK